MTSANDFEKKVWTIVSTLSDGKKINLQWNTGAEAKLHKSRITQIQKELRLVKREIAASIKALNSLYTSQKAKVGKGFGAGLAAGLLGKKSVGKMNVSMRDSIRRDQLKAVAPYEDVNRLTDIIIVQLDQFKLQLDSWLVANSPR